MTRILTLALLSVITLGLSAQRYKNPQQYFREFESQNRKINRKNLMYLEASLKGEDDRKVAKYREMMIEQLRESKKELERVGPYQDYEILQREYIDALDMYLKAYENGFGIAEELVANRYNSYNDLKKYYDAVTEAEGKLLDAAYKMEKADDHFAKMHFFTIERDEETQEQYRKLDEVTLYSRDMTLAFFRVEQHVKSFLNAIESEKRDTLTTIVGSLQRDIKVAQNEIQKYADFDGEDDLYREVEYYLEEMTEEVNENLRPLAEQLRNQYLDEKDYKSAHKDLERFISRHNSYVEDYFDTMNELILDYLPED